MSHYLAYVLIPGVGDPDELVAEAMAPYDESREIEKRTEDGREYWFNPRGFWDWYQIGGRWTGRLSGYDPDTDPNTLAVCWLCQGSGFRTDALGLRFRELDPEYTCNGCSGEGEHPLWPTQRPRHSGDIQEVLAVLPTLTEEDAPYAFIVHGSESVAKRKRYVPDAPDGQHFVEEWPPGRMLPLIFRTVSARREAGLAGDRIVVVDYHN